MSTAAVSSGSPKKAASKAKNVAKPASPASHPKYTEMITKAVTELKERGGSSRAAILKYILAQYPVKQDPAAVNRHVKHALQSMTAAGTLKHAKTTSNGAMGRFKLGDKKAKAPKAAAKKTTKPAASKPKSVTKKATSKPKSPKKARTAKPKKAAVKPVKAAGKSPKKATKAAGKSPKKSAKK